MNAEAAKAQVLQGAGVAGDQGEVSRCSQRGFWVW